MPDTRLEAFIKSRRIKIYQLAIESRCARPHLQRIVKGSGLTVAVLIRIVRAARLLSNENVKANQLFDLGDDEPPATRKSVI